MIRRLAASLGLGDAQVDEGILDVKKHFFSTFSGVTVFRDSAVSVAQELGLSGDDIHAFDV